MHLRELASIDVSCRVGYSSGDGSGRASQSLNKAAMVGMSIGGGGGWEGIRAVFTWQLWVTYHGISYHDELFWRLLIFLRIVSYCRPTTIMGHVLDTIVVSRDVVGARLRSGVTCKLVFTTHFYCAYYRAHRFDSSVVIPQG
jgi:hypothetical protein